MRSLDNRGVLTVPLLLSLLAVCLAGFGIDGVMRRWRHLTELQLRLDRCVGSAALELKRTLNAIETGNRELQALRATAIASGGVAAFRPAMELVAGRQDLDRLRWELRQTQWLVKRGCEGAADLPAPLPSMSWHRPLPDLIGPRPLSWTLGAPKSLRLKLVLWPRQAAATVAPETGALGPLKGWAGASFWKASWGSLRTDID